MSTSTKPTVCVIIPTMQRKTFLDETLSFLLESSYPHDRLEIFIVDGGSTDGSAELVSDMNAASDISIRWHSDPSLRVSSARNYAIKATGAEYLVFVDDDCITDPGWIGALVEPLISGDCDITGGTDVAPDDDPFVAKCEDVAFRSMAGSGGVRGGTAVAITDFCPATCNMAMGREKMIQLGCFDDSLKAVEDTEFVYKSKAAGMKVVFVPGATLKHRRRASVRSICYHNYIRGYGRLFLCRRYPKQPQGAFFLPAIALVAGVMLLVAGLMSPTALWILGAGLCLYTALLLTAGIQGVVKLHRASPLLLVPFLVAMHHFWYAIGILHGPLTKYRNLHASEAGSVADPFGVRNKAGSDESDPTADSGGDT